MKGKLVVYQSPNIYFFFHFHETMTPNKKTSCALRTEMINEEAARLSAPSRKSYLERDAQISLHPSPIKLKVFNTGR